MTNSLQDLSGHLFAQLDRLAKDDLSPEQIEQEVKRAQAIVGLSDTIIDNGRLQLGAAKLFAEHGQSVLPHLPQIAAPKSTREPGT